MKTLKQLTEEKKDRCLWCGTKIGFKLLNAERELEEISFEQGTHLLVWCDQHYARGEALAWGLVHGFPEVTFEGEQATIFSIQTEEEEDAMPEERLVVHTIGIDNNTNESGELWRMWLAYASDTLAWAFLSFLKGRCEGVMTHCGIDHMGEETRVA